MADNLNQIRGWLLVYIAWAIFGIIFAMFSNGNGLCFYARELPAMLPAGIITFVLVCLFYGIYAFLLYRLVRKRPGIVRSIKAIIIATPIFNAALPTLFACAVIATANTTVPLADIIQSAYTPEIIGSIVGAAIMAAIWHRYFCVSRRVQTIWPRG